MDLLEQEFSNKKKTSSPKKIVLMLLILCIVLLIILLAAVFVIKGNQTKELSLEINGKKADLNGNIIIAEEGGNKYISLKQLATFIEYDYVKGGYLEAEENDKKCYLSSSNQVIEFEVNSNNIYKIYSNNNIDNEYYKLKNEIVQSNDELYIALEDLNVGCNAIYTFSEQENKMLINTVENLYQTYKDSFSQQGISISDNSNNKKALAYDMIVATNQNGKMGVINFNLESIINYKYATMQFDEFSQNFIVSNENKFGIISKEGRAITELKYESIKIINNSPLLYEIKLNGKYGVLDEAGKNITKIEYDKIGFSENSNIIKPALIIKDLDNNKDGIVVCKDNKYGIVNLDTKEMIINCETEKIYAKDDKYYVKVEDNEIELSRYIDIINTTTVVTN